ncbi:MAG: DnaJ domain-containing protein [Spirochaetales bacterium]|nr:DnaJ domain-containing protein [Leptospiraceae bacterium]MCP5480038.1 DnaJ domain-containing protein [Spirochaetales bacterium]MCP5485621.1 DnaJ domain-containing protein [Spirochaetales bacterium]
MTGPAAAERVFVDHYTILGIAPGSGAEDIKRAFRGLAKIHHPDVSHDDGLRFLEIYTAYRVLRDPIERSRHDLQLRLREIGAQQSVQLVPPSRVKYPGTVVQLARRGLLRRRYRSRDRLRHLKIDFDLEVFLSREELRRPLRVTLPLIARTLCPDCRGSDPDCPACTGRGTYKSSRNVFVHFEGGLFHGQIIELNLSRLRPAPLSHFKRRKVRVKISPLTPTS